MITRLHSCHQRQGSLLVEASLAMGLTAMLALMLMRASLLSISGNQWAIMQTLTDAYLTRETAVANRTPFADVTAVGSAWPDQTAQVPLVNEQTVVLGRLSGGKSVQAILRRFRTPETPQSNEISIAIWRLHSVLTYRIGEEVYTKSRSTLRVQ